MANLVIDIGNSSVKLAVFNQRELIFNETLAEIENKQLENLIIKHHISNSILSSVRQPKAETDHMLQSATIYTRFSSQTPLPINNQYQTPNTLGPDRLAALMGARHIYPKKNTLVIDAGTCITYDLIDQQDRYFGGSISPGIQMRLKAMHDFTGKLPLVTFNPDFKDAFGKDTQTSILSGVINGVIAELKGMIENYLEHYPEMNILLCGGDANFFDTRLKNSIFAHNLSLKPDLVLIGLNEVIHHQHD